MKYTRRRAVSNTRKKMFTKTNGDCKACFTLLLFCGRSMEDAYTPYGRRVTHFKRFSMYLTVRWYSRQLPLKTHIWSNLGILVPIYIKTSVCVPEGEKFFRIRAPVPCVAIMLVNNSEHFVNSQLTQRTFEWMHDTSNKIVFMENKIGLRFNAFYVYQIRMIHTVSIYINMYFILNWCDAKELCHCSIFQYMRSFIYVFPFFFFISLLNINA